jgi:hypothetical protein
MNIASSMFDAAQAVCNRLCLLGMLNGTENNSQVGSDSRKQGPTRTWGVQLLFKSKRSENGL